MTWKKKVGHAVIWEKFFFDNKGTDLDGDAAYTVCSRPNKETSMAGMVWGEGTEFEKQ